MDGRIVVLVVLLGALCGMFAATLPIGNLIAFYVFAIFAVLFFKRGFPSIWIYAIRDIAVALLFLGWLYAFRRSGRKISDVPFSPILLVFALIVLLQLFNPLSSLDFFSRLTRARILLLAIPAYFLGYRLISSMTWRGEARRGKVDCSLRGQTQREQANSKKGGIKNG